MIPFEHILDIFFGIDTILKPYRIGAIVLIIVYGLKIVQENKLSLSKNMKEDIFFYCIFFYGILISLIQIIRAPFVTKFFYNDLFQISLYLATFFIMKNSFFTISQWRKILWFLIIGLLVNSVYLFYNFYYLSNHTREHGFMDNPNYVALGVIVTLSFFLFNLLKRTHLINRAWILTNLFFAIIILTITGSRTGLVILVIALGSIFLLSTTRQKIISLGWGLIFGGLFLFTNIGNINLSQPNILAERLDNASFSEDPRLVLWEGAMQAAQDHYFLGMGIGQFRANFYTYFAGSSNTIIYRQLLYDAALTEHSDYFALLTGYGIIGLLLYLFYLFISLKKQLGFSQYNISTEAKQFYQLNIIILISLIILGLTTENFHSPLFWFLLGYSTNSLWDR